MRYTVFLFINLISFIFLLHSYAYCGPLSTSLSGKEDSTTGAPEPTLKFSEDSLLREIEGKILQSRINEQTLAMDFKSISEKLNDYSRSPKTIENNYRQLLVLMNISVGNPYEERMYYNQLFELDSNLEESIAHYKIHAQTIASNIALTSEAIQELLIVPELNASEELITKSREFIPKLRNQLKQLESNEKLIRTRLDELTELDEKISEGINRLSEEMPELFLTYLLKLRVPIYKPEVFKRAYLAPAFWLHGQPYQSLAKMPTTVTELVQVTVIPIMLTAIFFVWTRKQRISFATAITSTSSTSRKVLLQLWILAPLATGFLIAAQMIQFPSSILPFRFGELLFYLAVMKIAWCLRILKKGSMPTTPFYPLYWIFVLGTVAQFLHVPLVMMAVLWPIALAAAIYTMWIFRQREYPALEKHLITVSAWILAALCLLSIEGHTFMAILLAMGYFLCAISLQLGTAISAMLKEKTTECFNRKSGIIKGTVFSLLIPIVWLVILLSLIVWTVCQFGEMTLLYRILFNVRFMSTFITLMLTVLSLRVLTSCELAHSSLESSGRRPLRGFIQVARLIIFLLGSGTAACFAVGSSPWALLGGLGAVAAALLFIFKDTILALVAGVRIIVDDLVRINDWIEIPDLGVDGNVVDVSLHCVKIRNFDRTILTIPTTTLTKNSFKNWRGMQESGGRRIKRSIPIDLSSVAFLNNEQLDDLKKIGLINEWLAQQDVQSSDRGLHCYNGITELNGPTNLGAFRAYIDEWLNCNEQIHKGLTFMVRHLEPTSAQGLPMEIYVFANETDWGKYESIQADIFDHFLAVVPYFGLRVYQRNALFDRRENEINGDCKTE